MKKKEERRKKKEVRSKKKEWNSEDDDDAMAAKKFCRDMKMQFAREEVPSFFQADNEDGKEREELCGGSENLYTLRDMRAMYVGRENERLGIFLLTGWVIGSKYFLSPKNHFFQPLQSAVKNLSKSSNQRKKQTVTHMCLVKLPWISTCMNFCWYRYDTLFSKTPKEIVIFFIELHYVKLERRDIFASSPTLELLSELAG